MDGEGHVVTEMFLNHFFYKGLRGTIKIVSKRHLLLHDVIDGVSAPHDNFAPVVELIGQGQSAPWQLPHFSALA
jgi:hypothetical protein